jgi:hypothetical protein
MCVQFPKPFSHMLAFLAVFSFDFLALECLNFAEKAYFIKVYLWCIVPLVLALVIVGVGLLRVIWKHSFEDIRNLWREKSMERSDSTKHIFSIIYQHSWLLLLLSYLVLPAVSNKQLQSFDCIQLRSGERYLRIDTSIDCRDNHYSSFRSVVIFFIIVYQLIPITWWIILYRNRKALLPSSLKYDERLALYTRDNNRDLAAFRFLFVDYKCTKWWFEIVDMYRRIVFIGILPLVSHEPATRASLGLLLAIISLVYFARYEPYRVHFTNVIAFVGQVSILVTFYAALTLESISLVNFGLEGQRLGIFLVLVNLAIITLASWFAVGSYKQQRIERNRVELLVLYTYTNNDDVANMHVFHLDVDLTFSSKTNKHNI